MSASPMSQSLVASRERFRRATGIRRARRLCSNESRKWWRGLENIVGHYFRLHDSARIIEKCSLIAMFLAVGCASSNSCSSNKPRPPELTSGAFDSSDISSASAITLSTRPVQISGERAIELYQAKFLERKGMPALIWSCRPTPRGWFVVGYPASQRDAKIVDRFPAIITTGGEVLFQGMP
jgi:hypothetical protein